MLKNRLIKLFAIVSLLSILQACTSISKVEVGEQSIGENFKFTANAGWNKISIAYGPAQQWTREGITLDRLLIYSGTESGTAMHPNQPGSKLKPIAFNSNMQPDQLVEMFQQVFTNDGSDFKLSKTDRADWAGRKAVKFEFATTRKIDGVKLMGLGYAHIQGGKLYAMVYSAPRLAFFPREQEGVNQMMASAKLK
jgi:hypothetical protein